MKRNVCVDLLVYLTLIFTFGLIMGCCDNLEVRSITTISDNSIENELNHASCHTSQTDMESSLISFLESSDNTFRSGTKTSINLELINKEKLEKTDKTIRTVTDRIDYIDFYLYRVSSENNIKYAVTSNDLRI
ncbi:MAG: hypothetical protein J5780_04615, partial [Treponema sp.]|nr:hypothetical protein [Treponema sp.]